jgi:Na+-driven multidrug efflux pump
MIGGSRRCRSPYDREIVRLAVPALGALAAEPLYVLVDTAIVGHLGTPQLASLAIAATVLSTAFTIFNFLTYGTTAQVARLHGARQEEEAARVGAQAQWLSLIIGVVLLGLVLALARPLAVLMGAEGEVLDGCTCGSLRSARPRSCSRAPARATCAGWATWPRR